MKENKVLILLVAFTLIATKPAQAITWEMSKNISNATLVTIDSGVINFSTLDGVDCEVSKATKNPLKPKKTQWLRTLKCSKNGIEASIVVACEKGESDGASFTFNEIKGSGYAAPYLGCKG